ncbi:MAG: DUF11 domain-containing protein, partial [Sedimentisphaerales bacterium]|nr:DUF11 domain-containing protein [Sedimentisphaerales bacterium]
MEAGKVKKVLFVLLVTMLIGGVCETAEAKEIYAGGSAPNFVYHYIDGNSWSTISPNFNGAVLCICEYDGNLYAGTGVYSAPREGFGSLSGDDTKSPVSKEKLILSGEVINTDSAVGQVWRHDGSSNWTQVGDNLDGQVCSLSVYRGLLYAGTAVGSGKLYRYDGGTTWTNVVDFIDADPNDPINRTWSGFRSMYAWNDLLYTGDIYYDLIGYYDGNDFTQVADLGGSCIWDFEEYNNYLYASAFEGRVHRSSDGNTWTTILDDPNEIDQAWELEAFQGHLYVATGSKLKRCDECDGNDFSLVWTEPNGYEIISMISMGDALIFGTGEEAGSGRGEGPGIGKIYRTDDGNNPQPISGNTGGGIQSLYAEAELILTKDDDIENCVWRNGDINYRIDYSYLCGTTFPDIDDVNIVDELPEEVDFISASDDGNHDSNTHTVTWNIGTLSPGESGFVTLKVKVKTGVECGGTITNPCNIKSGDDYWISADVNTAVCDPNKTIWLDFDSPDANGEPNTQPGFMSFLYPDDDGSDVCGITIDILPDIPDLSPSAQIMIRTKLNDKSDDWRENGIGVELYPDLIYAKHPSGINITLWELGAGQTCTITLWAYDNQSENVREAYWNVNGVFAFRAAFIGGTAWPWCMENPCDYNSYAYDVTVTADDLGRV